jgi:hypothetical protein
MLRRHYVMVSHGIGSRSPVVIGPSDALAKTLAVCVEPPQADPRPSLYPTMTELQVRHPLQADLASTRRNRISKQASFDEVKLYSAIEQHFNTEQIDDSSLVQFH